MAHGLHVVRRQPTNRMERLRVVVNNLPINNDRFEKEKRVAFVPFGAPGTRLLCTCVVCGRAGLGGGGGGGQGGALGAHLIQCPLRIDKS